MAGAPVYSTPGALAEGALSAAPEPTSQVTADEAHALFLVAGPATEATPNVRAALRKLVQALPDPFRAAPPCTDPGHPV